MTDRNFPSNNDLPSSLTDAASYPLLATAPYPLLFVTISGSHLYGFSSTDSDVDLRGAHVVPTPQILRMRPPAGTIELMGDGPNPEDLVTQEALKFFTIAVKNAPYCLEQVLSPLVVLTTPWHDELRDILPHCVTREHVKHYLGFTNSQLSILRRRPDKSVKVILYLFRSVLTGIVFARSGRVVPNIRDLNAEFGLAYIDELIAQKLAGLEKDALPGGHAIDFYLNEHARLTAELERAYGESHLPERAERGVAALDDLLLRIRAAYA